MLAPDRRFGNRPQTLARHVIDDIRHSFYYG
jgi:hypothetical protein